MNNCRICANEDKHEECNYSCAKCCNRYLNNAKTITSYKMSANVIKRYNGFGWPAILCMLNKNTKYGYLLNAV